MRIGIDIKCLRYNNSGIGRYLSSMLNALQALDHENQYVLFSPEEIDYKIENPNFSRCIVPPVKILGKRLPGILWQQTKLVKAIKANHIDIFWGPEQTIPTKDCECKRVLSVMDFVYKRHPETMRKSVYWINNTIGSKSIQKADRIAVISGFTKSELMHFYPETPDEKVIVTPCGSSIQDKDNSSTPLSRKRQMLFVGSLEPRKNLKNLVAALEILKERNIEIPLYMTGPKGWKNAAEVDLLKNSPVANNIHHLGFVSDEQLKELYATSYAVVFPSFYEGFGLPVLEALSLRTPVLTSKDSVMESIAEDCGIYFDPADPKSIADTIEEFFAKPEPWKWLEGKEASRVRVLGTYRWDKSAQMMLDIFKELHQQK